MLKQQYYKLRWLLCKRFTEQFLYIIFMPKNKRGEQNIVALLR